MIQNEQLAELAAVESDEGVVSVYVGVEPRLLYDRGIAMKKLKSAVDRFERSETNERWRRAFERERERIFRYVESWTPSRGLAIFACEPKSLFAAIPLAVYVPTMVQVDRTTRTGILASIIDEFPRTIIAVVQKDKAAIYVLEQGGRSEPSTIESTIEGRHSQPGWSQSRVQRHKEFHVSQHLKEVVEELQRLQEGAPFDALILGGTAETTAALEKLLPAELLSKLVGTFAVDVKHMTDDEIQEEALRIRERAEREEENRLVQAILDSAAAEDRGVVGLEPTLAAAVDGRVRELAVVEDAATEGAECRACGYLSPSAPGACPRCGGRMEETNVLERAVERVYLTGGKVNFVFGEAREKLIEREGMGALLRY
jgi:peptide subunit release factor 1 (eRF1)